MIGTDLFQSITHHLYRTSGSLQAGSVTWYSKIIIRPQIVVLCCFCNIVYNGAGPRLYNCIDHDGAVALNRSKRQIQTIYRLCFSWDKLANNNMKKYLVFFDRYSLSIAYWVCAKKVLRDFCGLTWNLWRCEFSALLPPMPVKWLGQQYVQAITPLSPCKPDRNLRTIMPEVSITEVYLLSGGCLISFWENSIYQKP